MIIILLQLSGTLRFRTFSNPTYIISHSALNPGPIDIIITVLVGLIVLFLLSGIRIVYEYKMALKFRFGSYVKTLQPDLRWIIPIVETV